MSRWTAGMMLSAILILSACLGCGSKISTKKPSGLPLAQGIPAPINLLMPRTLEIHPFTRVGAFDEGQRGVLAYVQAKDAYGDPTKAFGYLRMDLYAVNTASAQRQGKRLAMWESDISEPEENLLHWDRHARSYKFKLGWGKKLQPGQRVIFTASFTSPYSNRLTASREIVVGE